ncbi:MAG: beta-galactosidase [Candidatus Jettenia caeni]|nr:MAG: beta-galactosidase [Candidatus Jettenia caeni]
MKFVYKIFAIFISINVLFTQWSILSAPADNHKTRQIPIGIMSFGWGKNFLDTKSLDLPYISGMTAYFGWGDLETEDGKYDFSAIDTLIVLAKTKGKIINLGFYPGANAPEWLYQRGVKSFSWMRKLKEDQARSRGEFLQRKSPLPWDPIFIKYWKRFISKAAERYKDESTIGYISLTGPVIDELATGILLKDNKDWNRFVSSGYTYDKVLNSWIEIIEHFQKVMPSKRLVLAIGPTRPGDSDVSRSRDIVEYIIKRKYTNISFLCVFLNNTWFLKGGGAANIRKLLKEAKVNGFTFGYQMAQSAHRNATWVKGNAIVKSLRKSLEIGIADDPSWIEVWHDDIIDPSKRKEGIPNSKYIDDLKWAYGALLKSKR